MSIDIRGTIILMGAGYAGYYLGSWLLGFGLLVALAPVALMACYYLLPRMVAAVMPSPSFSSSAEVAYALFLLLTSAALVPLLLLLMLQFGMFAGLMGSVLRLIAILGVAAWFYPKIIAPRLYYSGGLR